MAAKGWEPYLTDLSYAEVCDRATYYAAYEVEVHHLDAGSLRSKFSAIRWMHVKDHRPDPLKGVASVSDWMADYAKLCPPPEEKVGVPRQLLEFILTQLDTTNLDGAVLAGAQSLGFWFLLRSIEYLADDQGHFDPNRSLTWADLICRKDGVVIPLSRIGEATELTITVYSGKGSLHTCTRTLHKNEANPTCTVKAIANLFFL
jgi:hypothetical protein